VFLNQSPNSPANLDWSTLTVVPRDAAGNDETSVLVCVGKGSVQSFAANVVVVHINRSFLTQDLLRGY
jgi:hypothetical protein